jgi:uncharacterized membrane protein YcfT
LAHDLGWAGVAENYLLAFVEPFGTLWFIYLLPIFFVVTKLIRRLPWMLVWCVAALAQIAQVNTGSLVIDETCARFVYFYTGYALAPYVFDFAAKVITRQREAVLLLLVWALFEAAMVYFGLSALPGIGLGLAFIGALAVVALSALLSTRNWALPLRYAGQNSIIVYLAFFLPMAATRAALLRSEPGLNLGVTCLIVTGVAVVVPLVFYEVVKNTPLNFLFRRPAWARAAYWRPPSLVVAE